MLWLIVITMVGAIVVMCLIISINSKMSRAVALPSFTMKLPCSAETTAPPTRVPFKPSSSISLPAGIEAGFLNMHPALGAAGCDCQRFRLYSFMRCSMASREPGWPRSTAARAMCVFKAGQLR